MDELSFDGKAYVSSKQAAKISGYAKDYIGQLCREGRIEARLVGRNWYVLRSALEAHRLGETKDTRGKKPTGARIIEEKQAPSSWDNPKYTPVTGDGLPEVRRSSVSLIGGEATGSRDEHTKLISDMQDAWQEWFTRKAESEIETSKDGEASAAEVTIEEEAATPLNLTIIEDEVRAREGDEDEAIEREEPEMGPTVDEAEELAVPIVRITETKVVKKEDRDIVVAPRRGLSPLKVLGYRAALIAVSAVFALMALIGTGTLTRIAGVLVTDIPVLKNIAGIAAINSK